MSVAIPEVAALLRKRPSKRPNLEPADPQPVPLHATVIGPTAPGRCASVLAENPAPTIGRLLALAVKVGAGQPQPPDTAAVKLAVWLVKFACAGPDMVRRPAP